MKKLIFLLLLLPLFNRSHGQVTADNSPGCVFALSFGATKTYINDSGFKSWAETNYNKTINNDANLYVDLAFIFTKWDFGLHIGTADPYSTNGVEFGRCLTSQKSKISSFLNFEFGQIVTSYNDLEPVDYTPTADQQGKKLKLQYEEYFVGLTSKNYLNNLHFRVGKNKRSSINPGFFATVGYIPSRSEWEYGYNATEVNSDSLIPTTYFKGVDISSIPKLNNVFFEAGIFIGIGTNVR